MKNGLGSENIFRKFFEASENLSNVTVYSELSGGRCSGKTHFLSVLYKEKIDDIFYGIEKSEFIKHIDTLLTDFRRRYEKLPVAYPGDYVFYTNVFNCVETIGPKNILVENLINNLENYFLHIEIGLYTKN